MKESSEGLVPARGFLGDAMKPRPSFNDGSTCGKWIILRGGFCSAVSWLQNRFWCSRTFDGSRGMLNCSVCTLVVREGSSWAYEVTQMVETHIPYLLRLTNLQMTCQSSFRQEK